MAGPKIVSFSYDLQPPDAVDASGVSAPLKGEHTFAVEPAPPTRSATASYYAAASTALREAQAHANAVLTEWKDAIGDKEKPKEDLGKIGRGQGKAARMMAANKAAEAALDAADDDDDEEDEGEDEDGVDLQEAGARIVIDQHDAGFGERCARDQRQ